VITFSDQMSSLGAFFESSTRYAARYRQ